MELITVRLKTHNNGYKDKSSISEFHYRSEKKGVDMVLRNF